MNNHSESGTKPESPACQLWGLKRAIPPLFWGSSGTGRQPGAFSR